MGAGTGPEQKINTTQGVCVCVFFYCGRRQGKEKLRWAPARGQSKKKTPPRVLFFFLLRPRGKAGEGEAPLGRRHGARAKKRTPPMVICFCWLRPRRKGRGRRSPVGRRHGARAKKKHHPGCVCSAGLGGASPSPGWCFFFCCGPARTGLVFFFCCGPAQTLTHSLWAGAISEGSGGVFFAVALPGSFLVSLKRPGGAAAKKKNTTGRCFFFCCGPARTLTHSLRAGGASPSAGVVFFFFAAAPPGPGWVFFFLLWPRPDAHSLTVGWGDFGKARVVFFFLLRPRLVLLGNSKKCLVCYIGSKKTRRGHNKKKKHHFQEVYSLIKCT